MIGIVLIAHDNIADAMLSAAMKIIPDFTNVCAVGVDSDAPQDNTRKTIAAAVSSVDKGDGVLILTDLFGSTPTNLCLAFMSPGEHEVISGVNLPMLLKLGSGLQTKPFNDVVTFIQQYGEKNIVIASQVLDGKIEKLK